MTTFKALPKLVVPLVAGLASLAFAVPALAEPIALESFEVSAINQNGTPDVQAGSHPYELVTSFVLNGPEENPGKGSAIYYTSTGGGLKDVLVEFPPGFVGNPNATPKCNYTAFLEKTCPRDTNIGEAVTTFIPPKAGEEEEIAADGVYNVETPGGVAAEFGYLDKEVAPVFLDSSVRTGSDYGVTVSVANIPQVRQFIASKVTIWGVPAEVNGGGLPPVPLLTNPTSCGVSRTAKISIDGWHEPGNFATGEHIATKTATLPELSGCEKLDFSPTLNVQPDGTAGSTPTGLNVAVHVPQESTTNPVGLGEADVKDTTVALPPGVQISPSASDGLQACSDAQIGFEGYEELDASGMQSPVFAAKVYNHETEKEEATLCPNASKIANVRIATPLLEHELTGEVYLAEPQNFSDLPENPFSSLVAMYLVAEEPEHGVVVKLPGKVSLNEATGQITTTFEDTPQLPFSELKLEFFGTARAPLATPAYCGTYDTESSFVPWSGTATAHPPASFQIESGPELHTASGPRRTPCSDPLPFSPSLSSETTNPDAGAFTPLTTTLSREDGNQQIQQVTLHYPAGVSGLLSGVKLCGEAEANAGTCGPESLIGESIVSVGLGNDPYTVSGGKVYITGPYEGAPFGLSIVNPAKAGPFDLQEGRPVVVRGKIEVNPTTAALTVTTNTPAEGHAIPTTIEGIPLQIKHVDVNINREKFTFNPTSCTKTEITGTVASAEGASAPVSIPFQVGECRSLGFAPQFSSSTSGKTSRADGASLAVKLSYPNGPGYANIARVKVELPKGLPSRLSTLQKACTAGQFHANPAGCPEASVVGHAKAITPLIPVALEGPAYFVSNGGEAFPNLIIVLQGYGVTIELVGDTFISKAGITSSTFKTVPDAPVGSFELSLPEGPYSALTTDGSLCKQRLVMPTEFVAQNGATIHQSTKIAVTGCPKAKTAKHHRMTKRRRGR